MHFNEYVSLSTSRLQRRDIKIFIREGEEQEAAFHISSSNLAFHFACAESGVLNYELLCGCNDFAFNFFHAEIKINSDFENFFVLLINNFPFSLYFNNFIEIIFILPFKLVEFVALCRLTHSLSYMHTVKLYFFINTLKVDNNPINLLIHSFKFFSFLVISFTFH